MLSDPSTLCRFVSLHVVARVSGSRLGFCGVWLTPLLFIIETSSSRLGCWLPIHRLGFRLGSCGLLAHALLVRASSSRLGC